MLLAEARRQRKKPWPQHTELGGGEQRLEVVTVESEFLFMQRQRRIWHE